MIKRAVFNQKGGVGKTTIVANLAAIAASRGIRTLAIDLDVQSNLTHYLLGPDAKPEATIGDFFDSTLGFSMQMPSFATFVCPTPFEHLDLVAGTPRLDELRAKLEAKQKVRKLRQALERLRGYELVFIDTPPALNFFSRSALIAADRCLIPFDCDEFARQALYALIENIDELRADHNESLTIEGVVVNQFQARANLPRQMLDSLRAERLPVVEPPLPMSVRVRESHEQHRPLIYLDRSHRITQAYQALFDALASR